MMKNKFKVMLVMIIGIILGSSISIYATYNYFASDVKYKKEDGTEVSVETALNELYKKNNSFESKFLKVYTNNSNYTNANSSIVLDKNYNKILIECYESNNGGQDGYYYTMLNKGENGICGYKFYFNGLAFERTRPVNFDNDGVTVTFSESFQIGLNDKNIIGNLPNMLYVKNIYAIN